MSKDINNIKNKQIVFFDGHCGLCNRFVDFTLRKDKNAKLSMPEFEVIAGKGHLEALFKRYDKDKSDDLSLTELTKYIQSVMHPRQK